MTNTTPPQGEQTTPPEPLWTNDMLIRVMQNAISKAPVGARVVDTMRDMREDYERDRAALHQQLIAATVRGDTFMLEVWRNIEAMNQAAERIGELKTQLAAALRELVELRNVAGMSTAEAVARLRKWTGGDESEGDNANV